MIPPRTGPNSDGQYSFFAVNFKVEVSDKEQAIDPDKELCWRSLTVGWGLAKGMDPHSAAEFASYIRYHTDLG